jgi:ribosomal protein L7Ae-like RNA K-turn-binding protein
VRVTCFKSGTNAILQLLKASQVSCVIIAEDMCPDVVS